MKKLLLLAVLVSCISYSCIPDDSDSGADPEGPITANIRFEVVTSRSTDAIITTTIDETTETENVDESGLPYSKTIADVELESGTFIRLAFLEDGSYVVTPEGSSWTDYNVILSIFADNVLARTETFLVTEDDSGTKQIILNFE
ncbi:hypothetical protein [uncultured Psychroserpens sp.]|uniref:hypothetical protein n=1 Tax=uncultured Psychroserpens sp. TaxID=255436 RepID=UPI002611DFEF|nr:hypothetical protein [uncultured Psychroserpens sp.]